MAAKTLMLLAVALLLPALAGCSGKTATAPPADPPAEAAPPVEAPVAAPAPSTDRFHDQLGQRVTLEGKAVNAKLGAELQGDDFSIWLAGVDAWPDGFYTGGDDGKAVRVTGTVIEAFDLPVFVPSPDEPLIQGIPVPEGTDLKQASHRYLLKDPTWELVTN